MAFKLEVAVRKKKVAERKEAFDKMSEKIIELNDGDGYSGCVDAQQQYWIKDFLLYDSDKILESRTAWINASIIDASQTLLAHKFKHFDGFQTVGCGYSMTFCIQRKGFVQILYDEVRHHWLPVASVSNGIDEPVLNVYDSLFHTASSHTKKQIDCIVNIRIKLNFMDVTCQNGSDDCGLFAVAYATTICYGKKPEKFIFDQGLMRRHLLKCLENKLMEEFPVRKEHRNSDKVINHDAVMVHCSCRMPKTKDEDMIACSSCGEVYHKNLCVEKNAEILTKLSTTMQLWFIVHVECQRPKLKT